MVRIVTRKVMPDDNEYIEAFGLSTDSKPLGYATGSVFVEVNTGKVYLYDETSSGTWTEIGGSSGSDSPFTD